MISKKTIKTLAAVCVLTTATPLAAYPPVVIAGLTGYLGMGSEAPTEPQVSGAPELIADFRTALGESGYLGLHYSGDLWFSVSSPEPIDQSDVGFSFGWGIADADIDLEANASLSSPLSDATILMAPDWTARMVYPLGDTVKVDVAYLGAYRYDEGDDGDRQSHGGELGFSFDPSIFFGTRLAVELGTTSYSEQWVLDGAGNATSISRRDLDGAVTWAAEGLQGYFGYWRVQTRIEVADSNANSWIVATSALDEGSQDFYSLQTLASYSNDPTISLGYDVSATLTGQWYHSRLVLDAGGIPSAEGVIVGTATVDLGIDWNPWGNIFVLTGLNLSSAVSNDPSMAGWSLGARLALQARL